MNIKEILSFRQMVTPLIIQIIFWVGVVSSLVSSIGVSVGMGVLGILAFPFIFIFAVLVVRIWCEVMIVLFTINENIGLIRNATAGKITRENESEAESIEEASEEEK